MRRKITTMLFILMCIIVLPLNAYAHSGRTDANGGHHDYKNKSGLGSYHYHHGYPAHLHPGGVCPYGGGVVEPEYTPPSPSVTVRNVPTEIVIGESIGIDYTIDNATSTLSTVSSNNEAVIKVNEDKTLTAVGEGVATITIAGSGASKSFSITVKTVPVSTIKINNLPEKIQLSKTAQLSATVLPDNATDKTTKWSTSEENIISITNDGLITGKKVGNATISCQAINGVKVDAAISVYEVFPEEIKTNVETLKLECKEIEAIDVTILPTEANNRNYSLSVKDSKIAEVVEENQIKALSDGKTDIVIETDNGITKTIPIQTFHIPVKSVKIDDSDLDYIFTGFSENTVDKNSEIDLEAQISPADATFDDIEWKSSNEDIISIEDNYITVKRTGDVVLTAVSYDNVESSITLHITDKNDTIFLIFLSMVFIIIFTFIIVCQKKDVDIVSMVEKLRSKTKGNNR